ncbi:MAG: DUF4040 domain-containing protein [Cyanobacteria bacterium J06632_22]
MLSSGSLADADVVGVTIALLLPLTAGMLVAQVNPYHALVVRGILGAVAALVYAFFGAADVALTEALVGTMLSITLYAIAVRSSMSMRLGVLIEDGVPKETLALLRRILHDQHMRLELVEYDCAIALKTALDRKSVHGIYLPSQVLQTRVRRLHEIFQAVNDKTLTIDYLSASASAESTIQPFDLTETPS